MIAVAHEVPAPELSRADLWDGLVLKAREPMRFVPAITSCRVLEETEDGFVREIELRGELVRERVRFDPRSSVRFERLTGRARGTIANVIVSDDAGELSLRFEFALEVQDLAPGGPEEAQYAARMASAYRGAVESTLREIVRRRLHRLALAMASTVLVSALLAGVGCASGEPWTTSPTDGAIAAGPSRTDPPAPGRPGAVSADLERAIRRHDDLALEAVAAERAGRLASASLGGSDAVRWIRELGCASWHLAGDLKAEAMVEPEGPALDATVERRLAVVRRALPWLERVLAVAPDDAELLLYRGELLAYSITGLVSALRVGSSSRSDLERACARGAGPGAELALAKRWFHVPDDLGGDLARAAADLEALLARTPDYAPAWTYLGVVRHVRGERSRSRQALERARALDPYDRTAASLLANPSVAVRR